MKNEVIQVVMDSQKIYGSLLDIQTKVVKIVNGILNMEDLAIDAKLDDLGIDSISFIKIVVNIEYDFDIEFEDDFLFIDSFSNIGAIAEYVKKKLS